MRRDDSGALRLLGRALLGFLIAALLLLVFAVVDAQAAPGDLDVSFSGDGLQTVDLGLADTGRAVALQPDGKIVVAGYSYSADATSFAVTRLLPDGAIDGSFGTLGTAHASFADAAYGRAVALQPDGKIVVAGYAGTDFAIARFTAAGALDTSFSGDGMQTVDFSGAIEQAWALARQSDGRLIIGGTSGPSSSQDFALARLNTDGSLDTTFSTDARATLNLGGGDSVRALALQTDGRIVAAGGAGTLYERDFGIARFNADGSPDTTFSADGWTTTSLGEAENASAVAVQADGRIAAAGQIDTGGAFDFALVRYTAAGALDSTFGGDGSVTTNFGANDYGYGMTLQPNGRILVAGAAGADFGLARYLTDGSLDASFSGDGMVTTDFGGSGDAGYGLALQTDMKVVVAGASGSDFGVARYLGDDVTPPETTITGGPAGVTNDDTPTFTFSSSESGSTFQCRFDAGSWYACASPYTPSTLLQGAHTFEVRATDAAGNTDATPASRSFTVDSVAPQSMIDSGPTGVTNDNTPTFTFSANESGSTFSCRIDAGAWTPCATPVTWAALADGAHTFEVRATDGAGNTDASPASRTFTIDTTPPETTITSGPAGLTNTTTPAFAFSSSETGSTFQCRMDAGTWSTCSSPYTSATLTDGAHSFQVRATDAAGNQDASPASRSFTIDTAAPQTTIDSGPTGLTNDNTPTFTFSSSETGSTFQCRMDAGTFATCTSPYTSPALLDGNHTVEVRATDPAGNTDASAGSRAFTVDTAAPQTTIDSGPSGPTNEKPEFRFSSNEAGVTFGCRVDGGAWAECESPLAFKLADGAHSFDVRATDRAGNTDATPATRTFTLDTAAPDTTIDSTPGVLTNDATPTFAFSSKETGVTFQYRFDSGPWIACSSPHTLPTLGDGTHSFEVRAGDAAGNWDPTPGAYSFVVDTTAPQTTIDSGPIGTVNDNAPEFTFSSSEAGSTFECRLDNGLWSACTSPRPFVFTEDGAHTFEVRARDAAGNADASPAISSFAIETRPPETTIDSGPPATMSSGEATFTFSASEPGAHFECRMDGAPFAACVSPDTVGGLADGPHAFAVRAVDRAGNVDPTPAQLSFTVARPVPLPTTTPAPTPTVVPTPPPSLAISVSAAARQRLTRAIALTVRSTAAATVRVTGTLTAGGKRFTLKPLTRAVAAGRPVNLRIKPPQAAARALAARKKVTAKLTVRATGAAGQAASKTISVQLKR